VIKKDNTIEFCVSDNGIGMDAATLENLFNIEKVNLQKGTSGEIGTGLGLVICKDFIQTHKGNIWATSKLGNGSKFYFSIPSFSLQEES